MNDYETILFYICLENVINANALEKSPFRLDFCISLYCFPFVKRLFLAIFLFFHVSSFNFTVFQRFVLCENWLFCSYLMFLLFRYTDRSYCIVLIECDSISVHAVYYNLLLNKVNSFPSFSAFFFLFFVGCILAFF